MALVTLGLLHLGAHLLLYSGALLLGHSGALLLRHVTTLLPGHQISSSGVRDGVIPGVTDILLSAVLGGSLSTHTSAGESSVTASRSNNITS